MPRITSNGPSNNPEERWRVLRLGTSSSTSESTPDKSGASGTIALPSPVLGVESPFLKDPLVKQVSSSADLTDGSGQETGFSPLSPSGSSEDSPAPREVTPVLDLSDKTPHELMEIARESYAEGNYLKADLVLDLAEKSGANPDFVASARGYVRVARARALADAPAHPGASGDGPSEGEPASGGFVVP